MKCKACDADVEEHALGRKGLFTGEYLDLCDHCFDTIREDITLEEEIVGFDLEDEWDDQPLSHDDL